jgi:flagellar hook assembly protein FlgD
MTVSSVTSLPQKNGGSTTISESQLNMEQFLRLLTVQLATQNPLEPMNDRDFFAQLAQLGTVQGLDSVKNTMEASQTAGLIGKHVTALRPYTDTDSGLNEEVVGIVDSVKLVNGEYKVMVKEPDGGLVQINPENIQSIRNAPVEQTETSN